MTTSSNNTRTIEKYLSGKMHAADKFLFEARLLIDPSLRTDLQAQKKVYRLLELYHRKMMKQELETLNRQLFRDPGKVLFQQQILNLFKRKEI